MKEYLRLLATKKVNVDSLIQAVYPIMEVEKAFASLQQPDRPLIAVLDYGDDLPNDIKTLANQPRKLAVTKQIDKKKSGLKLIRVGLIGAGRFATGMHLPNLQKLSSKYEIRTICSKTGANAKAAATKFGAGYFTTDYHEILADPEIDLVMICTRHNLHGKMVLESLQAGKHTFVEKPLCIKKKELEAIKRFYEPNLNPNHPILMVGFNRRFSKYAREIKKHVQYRINPIFIHYRMNTGYFTPEHWVHTNEGGKRIIGESCHVIDLFSYLIDSPVRTFTSASVRPKTNSISSSDNKSIVLEYEDGSVATLEYFSIGSQELAKEYFESHYDEKSIVMNNYRSIVGYGMQGLSFKTSTYEKGLLEELKVLAECLSGENKNWPIPLTSLIDTTHLTFHL